MTSFEEFTKVCNKVEGISGSLETASIVADFLKNVDDNELGIVTRFIMGNVFPVWSSLEPGIGPSLLYTAISKASSLPVKRVENFVKETGDVGLAAEKAMSSGNTQMILFSEDELSVKDVYSSFENIARRTGKGSQDSKIKNLQYLFGTAKPNEAVYIARLSIEEMRIGVGEGIVRNAISEAFGVPAILVERGYMLTNDFGEVAHTAKKEGEQGLLKLCVEIGRPLKLMLAQISSGINETVEDMENVAVEWKFDGARVQIHKNGDKVTIYSRKLEDVTASLPDIVSSVKTHVHAKNAILDGEAVALGADNRPMPFQELLRRFRRKHDISATAQDIPLHFYFFDILYLDGISLIDETLLVRRKKLEQVCDTGIIAVQTVTDNALEIEDIYKKALEAGHEGVMLKNPESLYMPGKRGKNWLKLKPVMETLDLVVIGGEWGEGRRANFIGSYLLACHDPESDSFLPIGHVATGITDEELADLTNMFSELVISENGINIDFEPKIVFEVAFEEIQKSQNYESGYALRFPRLVNVRSDKSVMDSDSIDRIEQLFMGQKGR